MRWLNIDAHACLRVYPSFQNAAAWKHKRVWPLPVKDSELKVAVERSRRNRLPHATVSQQSCGQLP
jgi:hypothetical protein